MERRTAARASVPALDKPRGSTVAESAAQGVGVVGLVAVLVATLTVGDRPLPVIPATVAANALAIALVAGVTSYILYSYAGTSRNRAFLALASTFLAFGVLTLVIPLVTVTALVDGRRVLGGPSSLVMANALAQIILPFGMLVSTVIITSDTQQHRRPGRGTHVVAAVTWTMVVTSGLVAIALWWPTPLPTLSLPDGAPDPTAVRWSAVAALALSLVALVATLVVQARRDAVIVRWMSAYMLVAVAVSAVRLADSPPFSLGWYLARVVPLVASTALLVELIHHLGRLQRGATRTAVTDGLTGMLSRAGLVELLDHEIPRAQALGTRGALMWIDLDSFKAINDQLGHGAGDSVLVTMAERLERAARRGDTVARLGGDEFGVLVCDLAEDTDARDLADRLCTAVREPVLVDGFETYLTASVGLAEFPTDAASSDALLRLADQAMYVAKHDGGDGVERYDDSLSAQVAARAQLRQHLARALHDHDFELCFQPVADLVNSRVIGAEALVRWRRDGRLVPAARFVPFAERSGQIKAIGHEVVRLLADALDGIDALAPGTRVAFNLSAPEAADEDLIRTILRGPLGRHMHRLVVEVTEGVTIAENARVEAGVTRLRRAGAIIAIDDFGSGFANIDALQSLRPQVIKVDRTFAQRAEAGDAAGLAFLKAARTIGDAFGARVVAEGIETEHHRRIVADSGIRFGQGYLLGRPVADLCHALSLGPARPATDAAGTSAAERSTAP